MFNQKKLLSTKNKKYYHNLTICKLKSIYLLQLPQDKLQLMITIHQCPHYQRNCHIEAPCCKIFYACKLCHDQKYQFKKGCQVDRMAFEKVKKIKCLNCQQIQQPSESCSKCQTKFGQYTCLKCRLYQNNPQKINDIFHCQDCKMCRRGTPQSVTHCHTCNYCVPNSSQHKCIANNASSTCPVCLQQLHFSTKGYIPMKCGHLIHVQCRMKLNDLNCPSCGMADIHMDDKTKKKIAAEIQKTKQKLPEQVKNMKVNVLCNQCLHKTMGAEFHYYGVACQKCGTYNTKMI